MYQKMITVEASATTSETFTNFGVTRIQYITNDGTDDIVFNLAGGNTTSSNSFTLKKGETLPAVDLSCSVIHYKAKSGSQPFRAVGYL